jgi:hypothetical protein
MRLQRINAWYSVITFFCFWTFGAFANASVDISALREALSSENRVFEKVVEGQDKWAGAFCNGNYHYRVLLRTQLKELKIVLNEDGSVFLNATLENPYVGFQGSYQGAYSFCFPTNAWSGLSAESVEAFARVDFVDREDGRQEFKVHVYSVTFGALHTGGLPREIEEDLTLLLNRGMAELWKSQFGEWISQKISFYINKNIPVKS